VTGRLRIVLAGGMAAMPYAGVVWQVLHHLEGLRRLGHDVFYLEDTERWPYDPVRDTVCEDAGPAVGFLGDTFAAHGFDADAWAYRDVAAGTVHGAGGRGVQRALARADVLINLSAVTALREEHMTVPVRVYLETDPVLPQIEVALGRERTLTLLDAHTHHVTYATNLGQADCRVPIGPYRYRVTRPPVILDWWQGPGRLARRHSAARRFTTVGNWSQSGKDITYQGRRLTWSKSVEFARVMDLPGRAGPSVTLELALAIGDADARRRLQAAGWRVRSARTVSRDAYAYRRYVRASAGEFSVAKEQNVALRSGWFSDRTATYLAAGRPAVLQDTGFGRAVPCGAGLFAFTDVVDAASALREICDDYAAHSAAAVALARDYLRAEEVLAEMLDGL